MARMALAVIVMPQFIYDKWVSYFYVICNQIIIKNFLFNLTNDFITCPQEVPSDEI